MNHWAFSLAAATLLVWSAVMSASDQTAAEHCAGIPGIPGQHGAPGRDGRDGAKGDRGESGNGEKGQKGDVGMKGPKGDKGPQGIAGSKGSSGKIGPQGPMGPRGIKGIVGLKGEKGEQGDAFKINWKQCVWDRYDHQDSGLIQECRFTKKLGKSALRVAYAGTLRVYCVSQSECCSRWYFTFNGVECSGPMTIDGLVYSNRKGANVHRHRQIEGYCENLPAGQISVGFHIGKCHRWKSTTFDGSTGWHSTSRIMIEEVSSPQQ